MCCETCSSCCSKAPSLEPGNTDIWHRSESQTLPGKHPGIHASSTQLHGKPHVQLGFLLDVWNVLEISLGFGNQKLQDDYYVANPFLFQLCPESPARTVVGVALYNAAQPL